MSACRLSSLALSAAGPQVYVDALTDADLLFITSAMFPSLAQPTLGGVDVLERMIAFNKLLQAEVERGALGRSGAPWELNLRDVFRWCELTLRLQCGDGGSWPGVGVDTGPGTDSDGVAVRRGAASWNPERTVHTAYSCRFRTAADRALVSKRFEEVFSRPAVRGGVPRLVITPRAVIVGAACLKRTTATRGATLSTPAAVGTLPPVLHGHIEAMEHVALCVEMAWPCLLVGPASSGARQTCPWLCCAPVLSVRRGSRAGKTSCLRFLAAATGNTLREITLSSSADSTDLLGCFEQVCFAVPRGCAAARCPASHPLCLAGGREPSR